MNWYWALSWVYADNTYVDASIVNKGSIESGVEGKHLVKWASRSLL